jgi:thiosulfate dehydrogenase
MKPLFQPFFRLLTAMMGLLLTVALLLLVLVSIVLKITIPNAVSTPIASVVPDKSVKPYTGLVPNEGMWTAPDWNAVSQEPNEADIRYGRELIVHTAEYLGPNGSVKKMSNGMNCQNCHLQAGTAPLGNNYAAVAATYPKIRARSGQLEDMPKRINDCFERSLNGQSLELNSKEMKAMVAYMEWLGKGVAKGEIPKGAGIFDLPYLERAADPVKGKTVYAQQCQSCHMEQGQGIAKADNKGFIYPPLWGENSYNEGAGLFRMSRFAGFVKANMPLGATYENPILTDEQAWDVAAYVNSLERPTKDLSKDWPDISKKPVDHPFGPFADSYGESQHKYGPFQPIASAKLKP